jgi:hypothetical protein
VLTLLRRRAAVQLPLLVAILAVVVIGATVLGVCTLLLTTSQQRAIEVGMSRAVASDVDVTAFVTGVAGKDARPVADDARTVVSEGLAPFRTTSAAQAASVMRALGKQTGTVHRWAYLSTTDDLSSRARLVAGRWPSAAAAGGRTEAVVLEPTVEALGLTPRTALGHRVDLGEEIRPDQAGPRPVVIVGIFRPLPGSGWDRDPISAAGYDPAYTDGRFQQPSKVYGPFVVDPAAFFGSGSTVNRMQVTVHPDLSAPTSADLDRLQAALPGIDGRLSRALGTRVKVERIDSGLPATLAAAHAQQAVTRSTVLVVVLLGLVLTAAALGLAGRLVAALRAEEAALLSRLGAGPGRLAAIAATEALGLAGLATVIAVPLSGLVHSGLTRLPLLADAGLSARPGVSPAQIAAVAGGAVILAAVLVVPSLRPDPAQLTGLRGRLALLTRSGGDLALLALAAVGWWQLRAQPGSGGGPDAVRVLAPALFLLAGAALALRLVAPPLRAASWWAGRSRALVLPLAAFEAARRPQAAAAALLVALAAAAGTFGLAFGSTWEQSQRDQAELRVGTDLSVALTAPPATGEGAAVAAATGGTASPVVEQGVAVGQWLGGDGNAPRLVAVDTSRAATLLRGRLPAGRTWAETGAALTPHERVTGVALPSGRNAGLTLVGTSGGSLPLQVVPRVVLQDRDGLRTPCTASPVLLDGRPAPLELCGPAPGQSIVALALQIAVDPRTPLPDDIFENPALAAPRPVTITLRVPTPFGGGPKRWSSATSGLTDPGQVSTVSTVVLAGSGADAGTTLVRTTTAIVPAVTAFRPVDLVARGFEAPGEIPVAVSRPLFEALRSPVGSRLAVTMGSTSIPVRVAAVVPAVPSAPQGAAILVDVDLLSRVLIGNSDLETPVNAWWVGHPTRPDAMKAATALGLGEVTGRSEVTRQLSGGPLRVGLPAALIVLVPAALLLLLAGTVMHVTSDVESRALEVARLRGLGLSRRDILTTLLVQHGVVQALLLLAGTAIGALAAWLVAPLLISSDLGAAPLPAARAHWPWPAEGSLLALLLLGGTAVVALVVTVQVRRADAAHLRVGA